MEFLQSEFIGDVVHSLTNTLPAVVMTICAWAWYLLSKQRRYDKEKRRIAEEDVEFLLAVEAIHCAANKERDGKYRKIEVRRQVERDTGLTWSGKNTPSKHGKRRPPPVAEQEPFNPLESLKVEAKG